jgi:hypothetical protein
MTIEMNVFQTLIDEAITNGVSEETIILLLLLPLVASIVGAARHLIGFRGFGIFIPTAIAVAFVKTGIGTGILVFLTILLLASVGRQALRKLRLHYLPRMALMLWLVTVGILSLILASPYLGWGQLTIISIFPIVILILLAEEFIAVQIGKSLREAARMTIETIIIALVGYFILSFRTLHYLALIYPHWIVLAPLVLNLLIGRFTGLRLLEYRRFRRLLK